LQANTTPNIMIKKYLTILFAGAFLFGKAEAQTVKYDSIAMGPGYANQIYYDMANGLAGSSAVNNWDIAHAANGRSACIRANHMTGLRVIHYPKGDTSQWSSFDTTGWKTWGMNWNDIHDHEKGAFDLYDSHPQYWGTYNSSDHVIYGDSLYLLVWVNGAGTPVKFQKFGPMKQPANADLIFRYANVDGSSEIRDTLYQNTVTGRNYKFYQFSNKGKVVREPLNSTWDISFNRYYEPVATGPGQFQMYPVMGVESNKVTKIARINTAWATLLATDTMTLMKNNISKATNDLTAIGSGWKVFDNGQFKWFLADTQSFMVKSVRNGDSTYWLIHFTGFGGSANGKVNFAKILLGHTNAVSHPQIGQVRVFPNPASETLYVSLEDSKIAKATLKLYSLTGAEMRSVNIENPSSFSSYNLSLNGLAKGMYILSVESGKNRITQQVAVQ
jgi:hypothetical protein